MPIEAKKILSFTAGKIGKRTGVPPWFRNVQAANEQDSVRSLVEAGAEVVESFGGSGDTFTIYRTPNGGYLVELFDVHASVAYIFIDEVYDYLVFRVQWLKPLIELSELADRRARDEINSKP